MMQIVSPCTASVVETVAVPNVAAGLPPDDRSKSRVRRDGIRPTPRPKLLFGAKDPVGIDLEVEVHVHVRRNLQGEMVLNVPF